MALQEEETQQLLSPATVIDALFCEEESLEEENGIGEEESDENVKKHSFFPSVLLENDLVWEDDELVFLKSKEGETHVCSISLISDGSLMVARKEAVDWILRVKAHYGFCALTAVLAVNYFDRFASSPTFKRDKPWMTQLAAVACLSLAAKVEETQVPLLLDLQVCGIYFMQSWCLLKVLCSVCVCVCYLDFVCHIVIMWDSVLCLGGGIQVCV